MHCILHNCHHYNLDSTESSAVNKPGSQLPVGIKNIALVYRHVPVANWEACLRKGSSNIEVRFCVNIMTTRRLYLSLLLYVDTITNTL